MNTFTRISTAALIASSLVLPLVIGTAQAASVNQGGATALLNAVSSDRFLDILGNGSDANINAIVSGERSVNLIRISNVYGGELLQDLEDKLAESNRFAVNSLRTGLKGNPETQAWFSQNGVNIDDVLAVDNGSGRINVYLLG
jgi:hypothetical protein